MLRLTGLADFLAGVSSTGIIPRKSKESRVIPQNALGFVENSLEYIVIHRNSYSFLGTSGTSISCDDV